MNGSSNLADHAEEADPLLDPATLSQLRDLAQAGNPNFVRRVFTLYLDHTPNTLQQLSKSLAESLAEEAGRAAHALKSMSLNIGARRVARIAARIEDNVRSAEGMPHPANCAELERALSLTWDAIAAHIRELELGEELSRVPRASQVR